MWRPPAEPIIIIIIIIMASNPPVTSCHVSVTQCDLSLKSISVENRVFSPLPCISRPLLRDFLLEICNGAWAKILYGAIMPRKTFYDILNRFDTIHECDRRTDRRKDGRMDTGRPLVPLLRIASRGKNNVASRMSYSLVECCHVICPEP